jgi:hypothetical protein
LNAAKLARALWNAASSADPNLSEAFASAVAA